MLMRSDISFKTTDGLTLKGWLYLSGDAIAHHPAFVMAHGFTAVKEQYLDRYVELFAKHGFAVMVYDNRNFGTSEDLLRQGRLAPYCKFVIIGTRSPTSVGSTPSMACGSVSGDASYSCGHVLQVAASDRRVKCVSSQVPAISGSVDVRMTARQDLMRGLVEAFEANRAARHVGDHPLLMNVVSEDLKSDRALPGQDCFDYFIDSPSSTATNAWPRRASSYATSTNPGTPSTASAPRHFKSSLRRKTPSPFRTLRSSPTSGRWSPSVWCHSTAGTSIPI
jgi:uncharacterized protein